MYRDVYQYSGDMTFVHRISINEPLSSVQQREFAQMEINDEMLNLRSFDVVLGGKNYTANVQHDEKWLYLMYANEQQRLLKY